MREDQLFGLMAGVAVLIWLVRGMVPGLQRRRAEAIALGLVVAGIAYALVQTALWFAR